MGMKTGATARIVAFVAANPGCTRAQIVSACNLAAPAAIVTNCWNDGRIHRAGPRGASRFFADATQAAAAHAAMMRKHAAEQQARQVRHSRSHAVKRRLARLAAGGNSCNRAGSLFSVPEGVTLAPDVRITIAPPFVDRRWHVDASQRTE